MSNQRSMTKGKVHPDWAAKPGEAKAYQAKLTAGGAWLVDIEDCGEGTKCAICEDCVTRHPALWALYLPSMEQGNMDYRIVWTSQHGRLVVDETDSYTEAKQLAELHQAEYDEGTVTVEAV